MDTVIDGIDYGPLACLIGTWKGDRGMDVAPESDGTTEKSPYYEEIVFEAAGDVDNADEQVLAIVRYHQHVYRKSNDKQFHDQVGYWLWDAAQQQIIQTLSIPRAVSLLAAGTARTDDDGVVHLHVASQEGDDWGVVQAPFMKSKARTTAYEMNMSVRDDVMRYRQSTMLEIYGGPFDHTDNSILKRQ